MASPVRAGGFDVIVVGGGVVGLAAAAANARAGRSVLILEQEAGIARGITSRNSEVIHAGLYYPQDSLKATLCVEGRRALYAFCEARGVEARRLGKWIVSTRAEEDATLEELLARGLANGVSGLELIRPSVLERDEPAVRARGALLSAESGIVDAHGLCLALLHEAESHGAVLALERRLIHLEAQSWGWRASVQGAHAEEESVDASVIVDAAGLDADRVAELAGIDVDAARWRQQLCKGDYFRLAAKSPITIRRLIYPVPSGAGLGIHATLDLAGRVRFGPDAVYTEERSFDVEPEKGNTFREAVARFLPALGAAAFVPDYAGLRPKLAGPGEAFRDFVLEEASPLGAPGFVACVGMESPGLTAALAIADRITELISI